MIIVSLSEKLENEKRVSITPEIAKKYINLGFEIQLSENYGTQSGNIGKRNVLLKKLATVWNFYFLKGRQCAGTVWVIECQQQVGCRWSLGDNSNTFQVLTFKRTIAPLIL